MIKIKKPRLIVSGGAFSCLKPAKQAHWHFNRRLYT